MAWLSLARADALYRAGGGSDLALDDPFDDTPTDTLDEILTLLEINDHGALAQRRATHVGGKLTWARLATLAVDYLTPALLRGHEVERALLLGARLAQRDADKRARVTTETRDAILRLTHLANALQAASKLASGAEPTERAVYALLALHQRWSSVRRAQSRVFEPAPILALVQRAAGAVLQSSAHASLKGLATKALMHWAPPSSAAPTAAPPKRAKLGHAPDRGEAVEWDDDDL